MKSKIRPHPATRLPPLFSRRSSHPPTPFHSRRSWSYHTPARPRILPFHSRRSWSCHTPVRTNPSPVHPVSYHSIAADPGPAKLPYAAILPLPPSPYPTTPTADRGPATHRKLLVIGHMACRSELRSHGSSKSSDVAWSVSGLMQVSPPGNPIPSHGGHPTTPTADRGPATPRTPSLPWAN